MVTRLEETFTVNRLRLYTTVPDSLATTKILASLHSIVKCESWMRKVLSHEGRVASKKQVA